VLIACRFWKLPRGVFKAAIHRIHLHPLVRIGPLFPPISSRFCHHNGYNWQKKSPSMNKIRNFGVLCTV
jgi:hypothetical protein